MKKLAIIILAVFLVLIATSCITDPDALVATSIALDAAADVIDVFTHPYYVPTPPPYRPVPPPPPPYWW